RSFARASGLCARENQRRFFARASGLCAREASIDCPCPARGLGHNTEIAGMKLRNKAGYLLPMDYQVNLEVFRGPLDLLLFLVKRHEVDIFDIPVARLTEQYLEYLGLIEMIDVEHAGDFLVMAATLMEIKS